MKTDTTVFSFTKPTPTSIIASNRIATFIAETLGTHVVHDDSIAAIRAKNLILVNGAFAFCKVLPQLAEAIQAADRVIWVQNDYTIAPPKVDSKGVSPFRAAFRLRAQKRKKPMDFWTTIKVMSDATPNSRYINWNALTFDMSAYDGTYDYNSKPVDDLFYYGAYRHNREAYFNRYFQLTGAKITIASSSDKFNAFRLDGLVNVTGAVPEVGFYEELNRHGFGLYIEDRRSHKEFHSPANRFYEMLSAHLPMLFQPESVPMLAEAGFDVTPFVVTDPFEPAMLRRSRKKIHDQQSKLVRHFRKELEVSVKTASKTL